MKNVYLLMLCSDRDAQKLKPLNLLKIKLCNIDPSATVDELAIMISLHF